MSWFEKHGFQRWDTGAKRSRFDVSNKAALAILAGLVCLVPVFFTTLGDARKARDEQGASVPMAAPQAAETEVVESTAPKTDLSSERVYQTVSPSVVVVKCGSSQGSGVVIGTGLVVTNRHVVQDHGQCEVINDRGERYQADQSFVDKDYDLCILRSLYLQNPAVQTASYKSLRPGQRVYAVGAPQGLALNISEGLVSSFKRARFRPGATTPIIITDAPISKGSSGGGLFDSSGRLVGITTGILEGGQRLNMALPVDLVYTLASRATSVDKAQALQGPKKAKDLVDVEWHDAIDQAKAAIKKRKSEWDNCKASRSVVEANIGLLSQQMNSLKSANRISEHNQLVPQYNQQVSHLQSVQRTCDQLYQIYTQQVDAHNSIVGRYNSR